jgi:hypothetical protein
MARIICKEGYSKINTVYNIYSDVVKYLMINLVLEIANVTCTCE